MDSSGRDILGDITHGGTMTVLEGFSRESSKECVDSNSERLLDEGKGSLSKGKAKIHDMVPPSPPNAKRLFRPPISGEFCADNAVQKTMVLGADQSGQSGLSSGLIPGQFNESEDISTESDEAIEKNYIRGSGDVTNNIIHMVKGQDVHSSTLHHHDADFLPWKENMVDGGGNLTQELLDSIGLGKPCSCSFCLKAAHMWMDLTFQDTRGRLSELQRSKKRAGDQIAKITQDFSRLSKSTKLEVDLMQHSKTIFVHTQDGLAREIAQTRSDLQARSKMMESCKRELESRSSVVLDKP